MGFNQPGYSAKASVTGLVYRALTLLIRADASTQIGIGHVMRCLALAQACQEQDGTVVFLTDAHGTLRTRLEAEGMTVHTLSAAAGSGPDAQQVIELAQELQTRYVVVDGYHFGADYQQRIKNAGLQLLILDDNGEAQYYYADLVLNQNIHANEALYTNCEPHTQLLLGTQYALLRREFWLWRGWRRDIPDVARNVLVTMGGSDPDNVTLAVLHALQLVDLDNLHVRVVVGGSNPHLDTLQMAAQQSPHHVELMRDVSDMPTLMGWADVAISAGGSTCWELAFMGLPSALIVLAENQRGIAQALANGGFAINFGWFASIDLELIAAEVSELLASGDWRARSSQRGYALVDGYGGDRVMAELKGTMHAHPLHG